MLAGNINKRAHTKWTAPILFAPLKNRTLRFRVDNRKLSLKATRQLYPIPRMDDYIALLGEASVFSTLDTIGGN